MEKKKKMKKKTERERKNRNFTYKHVWFEKCREGKIFFRINLFTSDIFVYFYSISNDFL